MKRKEKSPETWASWWAAIGNVKDPTAVSRAETGRLIAAYRKLAEEPVNVGFPLARLADERQVDNDEPFAPLGNATRAGKPLVAFGEPSGDALLRELVERAHAVFKPLFEGRSTAPVLAPFDSKSFSMTVDGYVRETAVFNARFNHAEVALWNLFQPGRPFPIRRCPHCGTLFERAGVRKFCSPTCQTRQHDEQRAGTPVRLATLRRAQQTWREKQRNKKRKTRRAAPSRRRSL